jgi:hypothetical protein
MKLYVADLHIHSCLSPCGSLEMSPLRILREAKEKGVNLIAVTDHNYLEQGIYLRRLAPKYGVDVLFGMELQTEEEVHLLCYFDDEEAGLNFQNHIYELLPDVRNNPELFGDQVLVDDEENVVKFVEKLLLQSVPLSFQEAFTLVKEYGGIPVPAHIDRDAFSVFSQLGLLPEELDYFFLEVWSKGGVSDIGSIPEGVSLVRFSDAHYPEEIGRYTTRFYMETPSVEELKKAARREGGRRIEL